MPANEGRFGRRGVSRMYAEVNELRRAIRAEGTPAIQNAWDKVEQHIDYAYAQQAKEAETERLRKALTDARDYIGKGHYEMALNIIRAALATDQKGGETC